MQPKNPTNADLFPFSPFPIMNNRERERESKAKGVLVLLPPLSSLPLLFGPESKWRCGGRKGLKEATVGG